MHRILQVVLIGILCIRTVRPGQREPFWLTLLLIAFTVLFRLIPVITLRVVLFRVTLQIIIVPTVLYRITLLLITQRNKLALFLPLGVEPEYLLR